MRIDKDYLKTYKNETNQNDDMVYFANNWKKLAFPVKFYFLTVDGAYCINGYDRKPNIGHDE